jgi:benzoylformate decarboxylase
VSLGLGHAPVLCVVGDDAALYTPQSLWTAAHLGLPVVFVVVKNERYEVLGTNWELMRPGGDAAQVPGLDLRAPSVDFRRLAAAFGVCAETVASETGLADAIRATFAADGPHLIEAVM